MTDASTSDRPVSHEGWIQKALVVGGERQIAGEIEERNPTIQIHHPPLLN